MMMVCEIIFTFKMLTLQSGHPAFLPDLMDTGYTYPFILSYPSHVLRTPFPIKLHHPHAYNISPPGPYCYLFCKLFLGNTHL